MPNWCENKVEFHAINELHGVNELKEIRAKYFSKDQDNGEFLDFAKIIPEPNYETTPVSYTFDEGKTPDIREDSWWDWRIQNWGTKWLPSSTEIYDDEEELITLYFDTAWCPPYEIYEFLANKYQNVFISWYYDEEGSQIAGYLGSEQEKERNCKCQ